MAKGRSSFTITTKSQGAGAVVLNEPLKIRRLLLKGVNDPSAMIDFQADGDAAKFPLRILHGEFRKDGLWVEAAELPEGLGEGLAGMFMIFSPDIGIMAFRVKLVDVYEDGWINLGLPDRVVRTQKRLDPRYVVRAGYDLVAEFKKLDIAQSTPAVEHWRLHRLKLLDISSTGVGLALAADGKEEYPKGAKLKQLTLRLRGREILAEAEVMSCLPHRNTRGERGFKVGVRFTKIAEADQDFIRGFVVEHLIQYDTYNEE
jgi:hypothetical protein